MTVALISKEGTPAGPVFDYFPYGKQKEEVVTPEKITQTFTGKEFDLFEQDTTSGDDGEGWYYFGARYYDADVGRWTSIDPDEQFADLYAYSGNGFNPIVAIDPDGNKLVFAINVSSTFKAEFSRTIQYLNKHGAAGTIAKLEARSETITIYETNKGSGFSYANKAIIWNPKLGFTVKSSGQGVSPAVGFVHEAGHALDYLEDPSNYPIRRKLPAGNDKNLVERSALRNHELPAAIKTGEGQRQNYNDVQKANIVKHSDQY